MKKYIYIIVSVLAVVAVGGLLLLGGYLSQRPAPDAGPEDGKSVTFYDGGGEVMLSVQDMAEMYNDPRWAYLDVAFQEAAQVLSQQEDCSISAAMEQMFAEGCSIYTAFDQNAFAAAETTLSQWEDVFDSACAITDVRGNLLAVYSANTTGKQINHAIDRRSPYSSFKALSVYTPALEKGVANWSSLYQDSAYKQVADENGVLQDWPANANNVYTQENRTVYDALRTSTNTVAVKCLADVGVDQSIAFLQEAFGIPLAQEEYVLENLGQEEVIGNVALGYLEVGLTPIEMAGYYQIFANGGQYSQPKAIARIVTEAGIERYANQTEQTQVIRPSTADTMNKLLQGVVAPGGTGESISCEDVEIAGKTGTGDNHSDNWFVGVTPDYSFALWHGQYTENRAPELFSGVVGEMYSNLPKANGRFVTHQNLEKIAYCAKSGQALGANCTEIEIGYYETKEALPVCDTCTNP